MTKSSGQKPINPPSAVIHAPFGAQSTEPSLARKTRLVAGVDGSDSSTMVLHWAAALAETNNAEIDAVLAWQFPIGLGWPAGWGYGSRADDAQPNAEAVLAEAVERAYGPTKPHGLRVIAREGNPAAVLIEASTEAALLVVGSRGHGGFAGLLLGSVSRHCTEHAHCPVLVIHGNQEPPPISPGAVPSVATAR